MFEINFKFSRKKEPDYYYLTDSELKWALLPHLLFIGIGIAVTAAMLINCS